MNFSMMIFTKESLWLLFVFGGSKMKRRGYGMCFSLSPSSKLFLEMMLWMNSVDAGKLTVMTDFTQMLLQKVAQLEEALTQKDKFIHSSRMIVKFREDHISRLEKKLKEEQGSLSNNDSQTVIDQLKEEIKILRDQVQNVTLLDLIQTWCWSIRSFISSYNEKKTKCHLVVMWNPHVLLSYSKRHWVIKPVMCMCAPLVSIGGTSPKDDSLRSWKLQSQTREPPTSFPWISDKCRRGCSHNSCWARWDISEGHGVRE